MSKSITFLNRNSYDVFIVRLRSKTAKKRNEEIYSILNGMYPTGILDKKVLLRKNGDSTDEWICFITEKDFNQKHMSSTLYVMYRFSKYDGNIQFIGDDFIEIIVLEKGRIKESHLVHDLVKDFDGFTLKASDIKKYDDRALLDLNRHEAKYGIILSCSIITAFILCIFLSEHIVSQLNIKKQIKENEEYQKTLEIKKQEKLKVQIKNLEKNYSDLIQQESYDAYNLICLVFSCLDRSDGIDDLTINDNYFTMDLHTRDYTRILSSFENNPNISQIQMSRLTNENDYEYASFIGTVYKYIDDEVNVLEGEELLIRYNNLIDDLKNKRQKAEKILLSDYLRNLDSLAKASSCSVNYIQLKNNEGYVNLEIEINGINRNVLGFIKAMSDDAFYHNIESLGIKTYNDTNKINCVIKMDTGIKETDSVEDFINECSDSTGIVKLDDLARVFTPKKTAVRAEVTKKTEPVIKTEKVIVENTSRKSIDMSYIGEGQDLTTGSYVFFKDNKTQKLIKFKVVESENPTEKCCTIKADRYILCIDNELYEVRK